MNTYIVAKDDLGVGFCEEKNLDMRFTTEIVGTFDAETWSEAMQHWYDYMGFGEYRPPGRNE